MVAYKEQIEAMKVKYDTDKKRWIALKTGAVERPNESLPPDAQAKKP
jgi:hypothetical protein